MEQGRIPGSGEGDGGGQNLLLGAELKYCGDRVTAATTRDNCLVPWIS